MRLLKSSTVALMVMAALASGSVRAASSGASSVSESVGASVGSLSNSLQNSSGSSTKANNLADGDYRLIEVAEAPERPGALRLTLQSASDPGEGGRYFLTLPQSAWAGAHLAVGDLVTAQHRDYGIEFGAARTHQAFFLVLNDAWYQDLPSRAVAPPLG